MDRLNCVKHGSTDDQAGDADIVAAGGMESMSMAPFAFHYQKLMLRHQRTTGTLVDNVVNDALMRCIQSLSLR